SHRAAWLRQVQPPRRLASTGSATAPLAEPVEAKRRGPELFRTNNKFLSIPAACQANIVRVRAS
ncbi:hypothetical protein, partial [Candidatus Viridilinea mediisalina]|uniref:hypothetical protein n=1 Tax=Candidatus Viridilinea mediisalina TaxID=2024553 RepID=UPI001C2C6819